MMMNDSVPTVTSETCTLNSSPTTSGNFVNGLNCCQDDFSDGVITSTDKLNDQNISQGGLLAGVISAITLSILILVGIVIFIVVFIRLRNGRKSSEAQNQIALQI